MTRQRRLKRRIRARMRKTGESYTTARRHVTSRLEDESRPAEVAPASAQERRRWRRPVMIAAVGVALAGAAVAAIVVAGGGGGDDANRYAATTPTSPSGFPWHGQRLPRSLESVPCSEMIPPAQLRSDSPERCFRVHPVNMSEASNRALGTFVKKRCAPPSRNRDGRCAFDLPGGQGVYRQTQRPRSRMGPA
jgi:hypothetical protein